MRRVAGDRPAADLRHRLARRPRATCRHPHRHRRLSDRPGLQPAAATRSSYLIVAVALPGARDRESSGRSRLIGKRRALGRGGDLAPAIVPRTRTTPIRRARSGATPLAYLKLAAVGLLIATAVAIGVDASSVWPLTSGSRSRSPMSGLHAVAAGLIPPGARRSTLNALVGDQRRGRRAGGCWRSRVAASRDRGGDRQSAAGRSTTRSRPCGRWSSSRWSRARVGLRGCCGAAGAELAADRGLDPAAGRRAGGGVPLDRLHARRAAAARLLPRGRAPRRRATWCSAPIGFRGATCCSPTGCSSDVLLSRRSTPQASSTAAGA